MVGDAKLPLMLPQGSNTGLVLGHALGQMPAVATPMVAPTALARIDSYRPPVVSIEDPPGLSTKLKAAGMLGFGMFIVGSVYNIPLLFGIGVALALPGSIKGWMTSRKDFLKMRDTDPTAWADKYLGGHRADGYVYEGKCKEAAAMYMRAAAACEQLSTDAGRVEAARLYSHVALNLASANQSAMAVAVLLHAAGIAQDEHDLRYDLTQVALRSGQIDVAVEAAPTPVLAQRFARWKALIALDDLATRPVVVTVADLEAQATQLPDVAARDGMHRALRLLQERHVELAETEFTTAIARYDDDDATMQALRVGWTTVKASLIREPETRSLSRVVTQSVRFLRRLPRWAKTQWAERQRHQEVLRLTKSIKSFTTVVDRSIPEGKAATCDLAALEKGVRSMEDVIFPSAMRHDSPSFVEKAIEQAVERSQAAKRELKGQNAHGARLQEELALQQARLMVLQGIAALHDFDPSGAVTAFASAAHYFQESKTEGKAAEARAFAQVARRWIEAPTDAAAPIPAAATLAERFASYGTGQLHHGYSQTAVQSFWWAAELYLQAGEAERAGGAARQAITLMNRRPEAIAWQLQLAAMPASPDLTDAPVDEVSHTGDAPSTSTPVPEDV